MDIHGSYGWLVPWYSARLVANPVVRLFPVCLKDIVQDLKAHLPRNQENLGCCPTAAACFWIDLYMTWVGILQKPAWKKIWRIHHELDRLKVNSHWIGGANNSPITHARIEKWIWFLLQSSGMVAVQSAVSGAPTRAQVCFHKPPCNYLKTPAFKLVIHLRT
jgi:hypothetical protein